MEFFWASLLGLCCSLAAANRHTVFWNSSNPKFWNEDYTVHVRIDDYLDIICPHYEDNSVPDAAMEQYTLYLVEHEQYQLCQPQPKDHARWFCKSPKAKHGPEKLSEKFHRFTGFTLSKDFKEGHSYYYISKPIHHQEDRCLRLKVMIAGKITHSPQAHPNAQEKRLPADDPEVQVLHSIGHSAAPRLFPLAWAVLLLPFLLLCGAATGRSVVRHCILSHPGTSLRRAAPAGGLCQPVLKSVSCWVSQGSRLERQLRHAARLTAPPAKTCGRLGGKVPSSKLVGLARGGRGGSVIHLASGFAKSQKVGSIGCRGRAFHKDSVIPGSSSYLGKKPETGFSKRGKISQTLANLKL